MSPIQAVVFGCVFFFRNTQDGTAGHFYKILFIFQQQERWLARLWFISHKEFTFCAYRESHWRLPCPELPTDCRRCGRSTFSSVFAAAAAAVTTDPPRGLPDGTRLASRLHTPFPSTLPPYPSLPSTANDSRFFLFPFFSVSIHLWQLKK